MNHKKILRLTGLYSLHASIRRANPYRKMAKANQEHRTVPNLLNREFDQDEPGKVLLADITYLYHGKGQPAYFSGVLDAATKELIAFELTTSLTMPIVYRTLAKLEEALDGNIHPEALIHSDQG
ncbi:IS3 family transposase, partial [Bhargavaea ullalensis]